MMRRKLWILVLAVILVGFSGGEASAGNPITKLSRGLTNMIFCPAEIGTNIEKMGQKYNYIRGTVPGIFVGAYYTVLPGASGIYDVVTFLLPMPDHYGPIMTPEFAFEAAQAA